MMGAVDAGIKCEIPGNCRGARYAALDDWWRYVRKLGGRPLVRRSNSGNVTADDANLDRSWAILLTIVQPNAER